MSYKGDGGNKQSISVLAGVQSTSENGYVRIGSFAFNMDGLQDFTARLFVVIETTTALSPCHVRLFDVTGSAIVGADPLFTSTSLTPEEFDAAVTLSAGARIYEVQMKMNAGVAPEKVTCSHCRFEANWSDF